VRLAPADRLDALTLGGVERLSHLLGEALIRRRIVQSETVPPALRDQYPALAHFFTAGV
jgi:hypothetical protein